MNQHKLQQLKEQRMEIRELLTLFERAAFSPFDGNNHGDPTASLNAIYETRIALQTKGAALVSDKDAAMFFGNLQEQLLELENSIREKYPQVSDIAIEWRGKPINTQERITSIRQSLGETYNKAAHFIRSETSMIYDSSRKAKTILAVLDRKINQLIDDEEKMPPTKSQDGYILEAQDLYQLRMLLEICAPIGSNEQFRAIFVDSRISEWRSNIPEAGDIATRINLVIDCFRVKYDDKQQNALILLLYVLADGMSDRDICKQKLLEFAQQLVTKQQIHSMGILK